MQPEQVLGSSHRILSTYWNRFCVSVKTKTSIFSAPSIRSGALGHLVCSAEPLPIAMDQLSLVRPALLHYRKPVNSATDLQKISELWKSHERDC